jgi:hypothetical protein
MLEFGDVLLELGGELSSGVELTLDGREQIDEPVGIDLPGADIFLQLLDRVHTLDW